jgi:hypothetical protein
MPGTVADGIVTVALSVATWPPAPVAVMVKVVVAEIVTVVVPDGATETPLMFTVSAFVVCQLTVTLRTSGAVSTS